MRSNLFIVAMVAAITVLSHSHAHACGMPMRFNREQLMVAQKLERAQELLEKGQARKAMKVALAARQKGANPPQMRMAARVAGLAALKLARFEEAEQWLAQAGAGRDVADARAEALVRLGRTEQARDVLKTYVASGTLNRVETALLAEAPTAQQGMLLAGQP